MLSALVLHTFLGNVSDAQTAGSGEPDQQESWLLDKLQPLPTQLPAALPPGPRHARLDQEDSCTGEWPVLQTAQRIARSARGAQGQGRLWVRSRGPRPGAATSRGASLEPAACPTPYPAQHPFVFACAGCASAGPVLPESQERGLRLSGSVQAQGNPAKAQIDKAGCVPRCSYALWAQRGHPGVWARRAAAERSSRGRPSSFSARIHTLLCLCSHTGGRVLDLGCSPGAWLQVSCQEIGPKERGGLVLGIDIQVRAARYGTRAHTKTHTGTHAQYWLER